jgi:adenosylcobyric acid synthase
MSNNSFVTLSGGEMGRAQVVQAEAARVPLHVDMNPVLLKPCSDTGAQVVVHGKVRGNSNGSSYFADTDSLFRKAFESLERLRSQYDLVVMEGAGSCAEVNLRKCDFVNFRMVRAANAPVILVADIDRGGVFAQLIGTLMVLPPEDRKCVRGFIINRFRGDPKLFEEGIEYIQKRTGIPVLGLIPYYRHIEIEAEDGMPLDIVIDPVYGPENGKVNIAVFRFPHISNFTDFTSLYREPNVNLHYLFKARKLNGYDAVILPGSKNVRFDLAWMKEQGWNNYLSEYFHYKGRIFGICGGYQMLGRIIRDPKGIEGPPGESDGLGFLDVETVLVREKTLSRSSGIWKENGEPIEGYEIHMGTTKREKETPHAVRVTSRNQQNVDDVDGAVSPDGNVWGTYFHGLFENPGFRYSYLKDLNPKLFPKSDKNKMETEAAFRDRQYDLLAEHFRNHLNMQKIIEISGIEEDRN